MPGFLLLALLLFLVSFRDDDVAFALEIASDAARGNGSSSLDDNELSITCRRCCCCEACNDRAAAAAAVIIPMVLTSLCRPIRIFTACEPE